MACAPEPVVSKLPQSLGTEFRWMMGSMLEKCKSPRPNMTKKKVKVVKSFEAYKGIKILQAEKDNCTVVLDECKYTDK
jgi:hypothetical protein